MLKIFALGKTGRRLGAILGLSVLGLLLTFASAGSQSRNLPLATGRLLVATERLADPRFSETVILLVNYDHNGAMGLILNRPTRLSIGEGLPNLPRLAEGAFAAEPIFFGGPVSLNIPLALLQTSNPPDNSKAIKDGLVLTGAADIASRLTGEPPDDDLFRIYAGYAGWRAGQLEGEIGRGDWEVRPFDSDSIFPADPEALWEKVRTKDERIWI